MLLKRLTLHGFKTFATRTTFEFHGGITAVIGPNGSGKSNLADAVRWVLGESSHAALRSKRTEDVIFAGSSTRPAMGMAEVALTIDNSAGLLPIDFAEVTITRRAYRDGENHYLINGSRVRLKDVVALTVPLGGAYTVVGQGLVDVALSLRPEERRGLFEHAAGITAHQLKRAEAERRLAVAEANCQRLTDILAELTPRLRTLERQARQAGEAVALQEQLQAALRRSYGAQWQMLSAAAAAADAAALALRQQLTHDRATLARLQAERNDLRQQLADRRAALDALRGERASRNRDLAEALRQASVAAERAAALRHRLDDSASDETALAAKRTALAASLEEAQSALATLVADEGQARAKLADAQRRATTADREARQAEAEVARLRRSLLSGATAIGHLESTLARLHERLDGLDREAREASAAATRRVERRQQLTSQRATLESEAATAADELHKIEIDQASATEHRAWIDETLATSRERLTKLDHDLTATRARLEALSRLRDSGAGLAAGPRAVLAAARAGRLSGILGSVATLIQAPAHLETALEVALGGHLQDIVVGHWSDAEAAIAMLRQSGAGRATFQPLDTLRPPRPLAIETGPGIVGRTTDLVTYDPRYRPLVESLLGRVLIVDDLPTAHRLVKGGSGWTIVTVAGEITRPGGAVTGGSTTRESGMLARERELRDLPLQLDRLAAERATVMAAVETAQTERAALVQQSNDLDAAHACLQREADRRALAISRLEADLAALSEADQQTTHRRAEIDERRQKLLAEIDRQQETLASTRATQQQAQSTLDHLMAAHTTQAGDRATVARAVADARAALVRIEERHRAARTRHADLTAERERLTTEERTIDQRREQMRHDLTTAEAEHARHTEAHHQVARALAKIEDRAAPEESALAVAVAAGEKLEARLSTHAAELMELEGGTGRAAVAAEHARGELTALAVRIEADLPGVQPASLEGEAQHDTRLEATIASLRERQRRVGLIDPAVIDEHAEARERHHFLSHELADIETAIRTLRGTIGDLDTLMRQRFTDTFEAVNIAFARTFSRLFNGGTARLILTDDGDTPGVDIVAHPPGKRPQSLALLSGGERALTAVALLFAILNVNPTPFCLLDEVDAALDESNVTRFRDLLADLATHTQFILVTHNRGTIEGADTLYGISMGQDGVSQVISLRLDPPALDRAPLVSRAADD